MNNILYINLFILQIIILWAVKLRKHKWDAYNQPKTTLAPTKKKTSCNTKNKLDK